MLTVFYKIITFQRPLIHDKKMVVKKKIHDKKFHQITKYQASKHQGGRYTSIRLYLINY